MSAEQAKAGSGEQGKNTQDTKRLEKSIAYAQKVVEAQKSAESLKQRAYNAVNPKERMRLLKEAYQKEVDAHGNSKAAKRLQSGVWQGGTAGGGIGAGIAMGVGAVTGTLVSGIVSVPTVLLGGLVGAGVGGLHGPWFTLGLGSDREKKDKPMSDEEMQAKAMQEAEALDQAVEKGANTVPKPPQELESEADDLDQANAATNGHDGAEDGRATPVAERKKPRKLQVRSGNEVKSTPERKKPRKLEMRPSDGNHGRRRREERQRRRRATTIKPTNTKAKSASPHTSIELRLEIYGHLFDVPKYHINHAITLRGDRMVFRREGISQDPAPALICVCRHLNTELSELWYAKRTFLITIWDYEHNYTESRKTTAFIGILRFARRVNVGFYYGEWTSGNVAKMMLEELFKVLEVLKANEQLKFASIGMAHFLNATEDPALKAIAEETKARESLCSHPAVKEELDFAFGIGMKLKKLLKK